MLSKSQDWRKILLAIGLLSVAANGIFLHPLIKRHFVAEDTEVQKIDSAIAAQLKMQGRLKILRDLINDINLLQSRANGGETAGPLKGLSHPIAKLGARFFPRFCLRMEVRLAKKERVNVARKMELVDVILADIERQAKLTAGENQTGKIAFGGAQVPLFQQLKVMRQDQFNDRSELQNECAILYNWN